MKRKGIEIINSLSAEYGEGMEKLFQVAAENGDVSSATLADAIRAVQSIEVGVEAASVAQDSIQINQGIQKLSANGKVFYYEEVEINDYPQKARYGLNNRAEMDRIQDWTGASVGIRGNYVPPGRKPPLGSRRLFLYIEADSPAKVQRAKVECINFLENASKGASYDSDMMKAYMMWRVCSKQAKGNPAWSQLAARRTCSPAGTGRRFRSPSSGSSSAPS